jgi:hypothetical protein
VQNLMQKTRFIINYFFQPVFGRFCQKNGGRTAANFPGQSLSFFGRFELFCRIFGRLATVFLFWHGRNIIPKTGFCLQYIIECYAVQLWDWVHQCCQLLWKISSQPKTSVAGDKILSLTYNLLTEVNISAFVSTIHIWNTRENISKQR